MRASPLRLLLFLVIAAGAVNLRARGEEPPELTRAVVAARLRSGIDRLNELYWSPTLSIWLGRPGDDLRAHYEGRLNPPWWPSANAVEVLIDAMTATGSAQDQAAISALYTLQKDRPAQRARVIAELKARKQWSEADEQKAAGSAPPAPSGGGYYTDFQNEYLDDSGWWGITWLKMYDRTGEVKYLATARTIQAHMAKNRNAEGAIVWCEDTDKRQPNSITNSLFIILSARLYAATQEGAFLEDAGKTRQWMRTANLWDGTAVVDRPGHRGDYWSYNQGAWLGALTSLYQATRQPECLEEAAATVDGILNRAGLLTPGGVLVEKLGTGGDAALFKGVLARYLAQLRDALHAAKRHPELAQEIDDCLRRSTAALLEHGVDTQGLYPAEWQAGAKDRTAGFNTQVSALALLTAVLSGLK